MVNDEVYGVVERIYPSLIKRYPSELFLEAHNILDCHHRSAAQYLMRVCFNKKINPEFSIEAPRSYSVYTNEFNLFVLKNAIEVLEADLSDLPVYLKDRSIDIKNISGEVAPYFDKGVVPLVRYRLEMGV
jgi:hypothetical protein